ncbi:MAG: hypothetical protein ACN4GW_02805 [Desulforhopalus sp.]
MKPWLLRFIKFLVVTEVIYLALINIVLNLPLTQTVVNQVKPEKFTVTWESAWSLYPFRVHARSISANGQSRSQQWQAEAPAASASISLLSLLWRTVELDNVKAQDVLYKHRPRPKAGKDYSEIRPYFPPIENRKLETEIVAIATVKKDKKPWKINIANISVQGRHEIWLFQFQGKIEGELRTDLSYQTRGGEFSLRNGKVNIDLTSLVINGDDEVIREGHVEGSMQFHPFIPQDNNGIKILSFLDVDAKVLTETDSLAFLNIYLAKINGMKVDGSGRVQGRLHLRQGNFDEGSDIEVAARKLSLELLDKRLEGEGSIGIKTSDTLEEVDVLIAFANLKAIDQSRDALLFTGNGARVEAIGNRSLVPAEDNPFIAKHLSMTIPEVEVPNLEAYQAYLPDKWPFRLHGGKGKLQGFAEITPKSLKSDLHLTSDSADVGIKEYRFTTNLDMSLKADSPVLTSGIDVAGSYVHLKGATLSKETQQSSKPWHAGLDIEQGKLRLLLPDGVPDDAGFMEMYRGLKGKEIVTLLDSGDEELKITGSISDLSWLSVLFKNRLGLSITGSGDISSTIFVSHGWPGTGSRLELHPQTFGVDVLDYSAEGDGKASLLVEKGGENPDVKLNVVLEKGVMRRKDETETFIEDVEMILHAQARAIAIDAKELDLDLNLQIPTARVSNMSAYNQYLPPHSPLEFTGGKARLSADIKMTPDTAVGYVKLRTTDMSARVDQQDVEGELTADVTLVEGVPENMDFDISGSSLTLDKVRVAGGEASHEDDTWAARFKLKKARAIWKRPIKIHLEADLDMTDSKPIVAVIANQREKHGWLEKALTIDDVVGEAVVNMAKDQIVVPYAFASSDKIDVGAKGVITADNRNGVLYVRYRKLHGILKINNGERNLDVLRAREKFDNFNSEAVLLRGNISDSSVDVYNEAGN